MVIKPNTYMKKIALNESGLLKIVNKVLNEQKDRQFNEDEIELLHFIFERELKPPFSEGKRNEISGDYPYYNRDGEYFGWLHSQHNEFVVRGPIWVNIRYKICQVFGFKLDRSDWWRAIKPHLKPWLESQLNIKIRYIE